MTAAGPASDWEIPPKSDALAALHGARECLRKGEVALTAVAERLASLKETAEGSTRQAADLEAELGERLAADLLAGRTSPDNPREIGIIGGLRRRAKAAKQALPTVEAERQAALAVVVALTGTLRPADPGDMITRLTAAVPIPLDRFDPARDCPRWLAFLDQVLASDRDPSGPRGRTGRGAQSETDHRIQRRPCCSRSR